MRYVHRKMESARNRPFEVSFVCRRARRFRADNLLGHSRVPVTFIPSSLVDSVSVSVHLSDTNVSVILGSYIEVLPNNACVPIFERASSSTRAWQFKINFGRHCPMCSALPHHVPTRSTMRGLLSLLPLESAVTLHRREPNP